MSPSSFARRIRANAEHLLGKVRSIENREYGELDAEWHNFLLAIDFGLEHDETLAEAAELWAALIGFIESRGYFGTWHAVTRKVAGKIPSLQPEQACRVANEVGFFLEKVRDLEVALAMHEQALSAAETAGNAFERALAILGLGNVRASLRRYDEAEADVRAALELLEELDRERLQYSGGLTVLGLIATHRGDYLSAERHFEKAAGGYRNAGHRRKTVISMSLQAMAQDLNRDYRGAIATLESALELLKPGIDLIAWTDVHLNLGTAYFHLEDYPRAKEAFLAIDQARLEKHGLHSHLMHTTNNLGNVALKQEDWVLAKEHLAYSIRLARSLGEGINLGNSLGVLAVALLQLDERDAACAALDEAVATLEAYPENAWARKRLAAILAQRRDAFG